MATGDILKTISKPVTPTSPLAIISKPVEALQTKETNPKTPTSNFLTDLFKGTGKFAPDTKLGIARNTVTGLPKAAADTALAILRAPGRAAGSVTLSAQGREELKPETTAEKIAFGKEPVKSIKKRTTETQDILKNIGFGEKSSKAIAPLGVIGGTLLDLYPGGAAEKKGAKVAAEEVFDAGKYVAEQTAKRNAARIAAGELTIFGRAKSLLSEVKNKLVDFTAPIEDVLSATTKKEGIRLKPTEDIHNQIDRVLRSPTIAGQFAEDNGIVKVIRDVDNIDAFDQYLTARHSIDLDTRGIETGRELAKDQALVKELAPKYEEMAKQVSNYSNEMMNYAVKSGLVSKDLADTLRKRYPNYVPFNRVFNEIEDEIGRSGSGVASLNNQTFIQKIEGSTREVESPLQSLLGKTNDLFKQGEKNIAAKQLAGYKDLPGNPFQLREIKAGAPGERGMGTITFFEDGKKKTFETTKAVADAAKGLDVQQLNILGQIFALPVRVARVGITGINPAFVSANMAKDQLTAFINSDNALRTSPANPFNFMQAIFSAVKHDDLYKEMVRAGGAGTSFDISRNAAPKTIESIRSGRSLPSKILYTAKNPGELLRAVENVVSRSEEFTRIQQYNATKKVLLEQGFSEQDAISGAARAAREATVNFARRGEWGNVLNSAFLYLNAGIQGSRTLLRNVKDKPLQTATKIAIGSIFPVSVITSWNISDPERKRAYEDIAEYEKENNIIIVPPNPTKDEQGRWNVIKIPLSQEVNNLASIPRKFLESAQGADEAKFSDIARYLVGTVSPINPTKGSVFSTLTPQAIKPSLEVGINKNIFTGKDIVPDFLTKLPPEQQTQSYTSGTAKQIGQKLNVSPIKVEAFIKGTFGGVGSQALNAVDNFLAETGVIPKDEVGGQNVLDAITARFQKAQGTYPGASEAESILKKYKLPTSSNRAGDILRKYGL